VQRRSRSETRGTRGLAALLALLLAAAAGPARGAGADEASLKAGVFEPARPAPDFSLSGSDGGELKLSRYRGKVVILVFGFTSCPDVCPTTLAALAGARKKLGAAGDELQVVYVTVDPERDSAERLREYLRTFDASFVGGTGSAEALAAVRKEYGIAAERVTSAGSYAFNHSSYTYLIDREGKLCGLMPYGHSSDDYAHDVRILLAR
jgi:protein SCO1/2